MNVIDGIHQPDSGEILLDGQPVRIGSPAVAQQRGVGVVSGAEKVEPIRAVLAGRYINSLSWTKRRHVAFFSSRWRWRKT